MRILFITRKYPPIVGGMENYSYNLIHNFKKINPDTYFLANSRGNKFLLFFILSAYTKALSLIKKEKITYVHICDGLLAPLGVRLKQKTGVKISITIHGLDITYKNSAYQKIIPKYVSQYDKIICVSRATKEECIRRGISKDKIAVIPNGINYKEFQLKESKSELLNQIEKKFNLSLKGKKVLLTSGRLVKRKGVEWFVRNVIPQLNSSYVYLIVGEGEEKKNIQKAISSNNLQERVFLLGRVSNYDLKSLYHVSESFIMPNIHIAGTMEGFGIVAIEAAATGLQVIASNIEGIKDAVINGKTGWLVKERATESFINKINLPILSREKVMKTSRLRFSWEKLATIYKTGLNGKK